MRKTAIILIAAALVLTTACSQSAGTSVSEQSDTQSVSSSADSSEEQSADASSDEQSEADSKEQSADTSFGEQSEPDSGEEVQKLQYTIDSEKPVIALTFDDGPNTTTTVEILDLLEKYQVPATFFLIGTNINEDSEKVVKRAYDMGCEIANHSYSHDYMNEMTEEQINEEISKVSDKIEEITGEAPRFFRPPYISVSPTLYQSVDLTFICGEGCNDWNQTVPVKTRVAFLERFTEDGRIILLHDAAGNTNTVEALDEAIPYLLEQGFQFATLSELFSAKGVELSPDDDTLYSTVVAKQ